MKKVIVISILVALVLTTLIKNVKSKSININIKSNSILDDTCKQTTPTDYQSERITTVEQIPTQHNFTRVTVDSGSFAHYLRSLKFKKNHNTVLLFDGSKKGYQGSQLRVIDIDVGTSDLQQCADAVMRLRAEYFLTNQQSNRIGFHFLNGQYCNYTKYAEGYRIAISGNKTWWVKEKSANYSYKTFRSYMNLVFSYCNTHSMIKEMNRVQLSEMKIGDVFIRKSGSIGHAMVVVDMTVNKKTGKKQFMLAQSYMPAQEMHVVVNPNKSNKNPWYNLEFTGVLRTPEWIFNDTDLYRFND